MAPASEPIRHALSRAVHFERFSGPLLEAAGIDDATTVLDGLARRGLFLQPLPGDPGWYVLHGLIREYARSRLGLSPEATRDLHLRAAAWLEAHERYDEALAQLALAGSPEGLSGFLDRYGPMLVLAGSTRTVTDAAATLPDGLRSGEARPSLRRGVHGPRRLASGDGGLHAGRRRGRSARPGVGLAPRPRARPARRLRRGARRSTPGPSSPATIRPRRRCSSPGSRPPTTTGATSRRARTRPGDRSSWR